MYAIDKILFQSKNSTLWICILDSKKGSWVLEQLRKWGCDTEGGVLKDYFAVNVPGQLDIESIRQLISKAESEGVLAADYPSIRH